MPEKKKDQNLLCTASGKVRIPLDSLYKFRDLVMDFDMFPPASLEIVFSGEGHKLLW